MKTIELQNRGSGMVDYFHGTSGVFIPVPVDNTTTVEQVLEELESTINECFDHFEFTFDCIHSDILSKQLDDLIIKARENNKDNLNEIALPDVGYSWEELDDDDPSVCLWLVIELSE